MKKITIWAAGIFLLIQAVPYGHDRTNPEVAAEPQWNSEATRALFFRACRDCHSYETVWPWYSVVAPISWLVTHDVEEGRSHFNVSDWGPDSEHGDDAAEQVEEDEMPLWIYRPLHPEARLSDRERQQLVDGLRATFGTDESDGGSHDHHRHHHGDHHEHQH
jgi:mono/diheme cytochrome c family protein